VASTKELGLPPPGPADIRLKDGDELKVGSLQIRVIHTPGHTPGSACFLVHGTCSLEIPCLWALRAGPI